MAVVLQVGEHMPRRFKISYKDYDMGDGFWVTVERAGSVITYIAYQKDATGNLMNNRRAEFPFRGMADGQIEFWRQERRSPSV